MFPMTAIFVVIFVSALGQEFRHIYDIMLPIVAFILAILTQALQQKFPHIAKIIIPLSAFIFTIIVQASTISNVSQCECRGILGFLRTYELDDVPIRTMMSLITFYDIVLFLTFVLVMFVVILTFYLFGIMYVNYCSSELKMFKFASELIFRYLMKIQCDETIMNLVFYFFELYGIFDTEKKKPNNFNDVNDMIQYEYIKTYESFICIHDISEYKDQTKIAKLVFYIATTMFEKPLKFVEYLTSLKQELESLIGDIENDIEEQKNITYRHSYDKEKEIAIMCAIIGNIKISLMVISTIIAIFYAKDMEVYDVMHMHTKYSIPKIIEITYHEK